MTKTYVLGEIKRTAQSNGNRPLGWRRFSDATGIKERELHANGWARYSEACRDAGFAPNELTGAYDEGRLLQRYAEVAKELGRLPTEADLRVVRAKSDFPHDKPFKRAFPGGKRELVSKLVGYCRSHDDYESLVPCCDAYLTETEGAPDGSEDRGAHDVDFGFVYLSRSGGFYKIGRSEAPGRRQYELNLQLPERANTVHVIRTDDPVGIEAYWHRRFESKRKNGEWFDLDRSDVTAFKRRKFM